MEMEKTLKKFRSRVVGEGIIKATLLGLIAGFSVGLVFAFVAWFLFPQLFWVGFVLCVAVSAVSAGVLYFVKYKPNDKAVAKRVDGEYDLHERVITMQQFKGDDSSYILRRQREDTVVALDKVADKKMKKAIGRTLVIVASVAVSLCLAVSVLPILSYVGVLPNFAEGEQFNPAIKWFDIKYDIRGGEGELIGKTEQRIEMGESTEGILALPAEDWVFTYWSDGFGNPYRVDHDIKGNTTYSAIFTEAVGLPMGDIDPEANGKDADDDPNKPPEDPNSGDGQGQGGAQDKYEPNNQVIDGETFYGDKVFDLAYEEAMALLAENTDLPQEVRDFIINYFKTIEQ